MTTAFYTEQAPRSIGGAIVDLDWTLVTLLCLAGGTGVAMLYSVAGGSWTPYALQHGLRFGATLGGALVLATVNPRLWMMVAYPAWAGTMVLLVGVELFGATRMGGQRWLDLGVVTLQPSEFMKIALVLALARYYHGLSPERARSLIGSIIPLVLIAAPAALIAHQPDLGTAVLLALTGAAVVFLAGISWWFILLALAAVAVAVPLAYEFVLHDYQRARIFTFLNPESDPSDAGYQILQSKIALGSGGTWGKGYLEGTQSLLKFLPENHTDFIFTTIGEEFGLAGGLFVLGLYAMIAARAGYIALQCRSHFSRLVVLGIASTFVFYVLINIAMVAGLAPVVGVPLPLVSYGGTIMMSVMAGFGIILSAQVNRAKRLEQTRALL
jgi:rod shape determining protein RodA